jgi:dTDP-glucose pyrophosphorylase
MTRSIWSIFAKNQNQENRRAPGITLGFTRFGPSIFDFTAKLKPSPRGEYELTDAIRDLAQSGKKVKALELSGESADVRDPEILAKLNA